MNELNGYFEECKKIILHDLKVKMDYNELRLTHLINEFDVDRLKRYSEEYNKDELRLIKLKELYKKIENIKEEI